MPSDGDPRARTLRLAAVQVESRHVLIAENHAHATPFIQRAAAAGAHMVVLPELFASGYIPNKAIWDFAEPRGGPTTAWLKETSRRLEIWLGAGLVETDGSDFLSVFILCAPDGKIAGTARKDNAEAFCFKRGRGAHVIDTAIGKIGVGICADNHFGSLIALLQAEAVDLMLMPHAWPTPVRTTRLVSERDIREQREKPQQLAALYARCLGVPVMFVNGIGRMAPLTGLLGRVMDPEVLRLEGRSRIIDSDGTLKAALGDEAGVITADVRTGRASAPSSHAATAAGCIRVQPLSATSSSHWTLPSVCSPTGSIPGAEGRHGPLRCAERGLALPQLEGKMGPRCDRRAGRWKSQGPSPESPRALGRHFRPVPTLARRAQARPASPR